MIITANKYVNARLGNPHTSAPNPRFLQPGDKVNIKARVFGEKLEGTNDWFLTDENEFFSGLGFSPLPEDEKLPFANVPALFKKMEIEKLWAFTGSKGDNISIGIVDLTGVANRPALKNKVVPINYNPAGVDITNHSTYMASIIAANGIDKNEVGIAPGIDRIYSYQIQDKSIIPDQLLNSLIALKDKGVKIINMSIASTVFAMEKYDGLKDILNDLVKEDVLLICSTGNKPFYKISAPGGLKGVISTSGFIMADPIEPDENSNLWNGVNVSAPYDQYFDDSFLGVKGTSNSCAMISGILASSYEKILSKKGNKTAYAFVVENLFSSLSKIVYPLKKISVPAYDTNEFINLLK